MKDNSGMLAWLGSIARKITFPKSWNNLITINLRKFMASKTSSNLLKNHIRKLQINNIGGPNYLKLETKDESSSSGIKTGANASGTKTGAVEAILVMET